MKKNASVFFCQECGYESAKWLGQCAGIRMVYDKEDNPINQVLDGKIVFRQYLAPYTPAEDILNILEFDPSMIETALGGGE